jgi:hypothetical protein
MQALDPGRADGCSPADGDHGIEPPYWTLTLARPDQESGLSIEAEVQEVVRMLQAEVAAACVGVRPNQ